MWFTEKYKKRISELEKLLEETKDKGRDNVALFISRDVALKGKIQDLEYRLENIPMADLMRESLGMSIDFAAASKDKCLPPSYLDDLDLEERKSFITDMESVYSNDRFKKIVNYFINLFATNAIYKFDEEQRNNNRAAVFGFRTFLQEFDKIHKEFLEYKKDPDEDFDPLETLPD